MIAQRATIGGVDRHLGAWRPSRLRLQGFKPAVDLATLPMQHTIAGFPTDYDQGQLGSCGPNSAAEVYDFHLKAKFSRLFAYYLTRALEGDVDDDSGVEIPDLMSVLHTMGMPPESDWDYNVDAYRSPPPVIAFAEAFKHRLDRWDVIADLDHLLFELANDQPVTLGFLVPASMQDSAAGPLSTARTGIVRLPSTTDPPIGGHCVNAIGFDRSNGMVKTTCHYGPTYGDGGCLWLPFAFFTTGQAMDLTAMRSIS